jgi:hypothetical protein
LRDQAVAKSLEADKSCKFSILGLLRMPIAPLWRCLLSIPYSKPIRLVAYLSPMAIGFLDADDLIQVRVDTTV